MSSSFIVGFTGKRDELNEFQLSSLKKILKLFDTQVDLYHNDGEGSDQIFASIAKEYGLIVKITPTMNPMPRNRHLISLCDRLIAIPPTDEILDKGSGTWETIKYAWKKGIHVDIIGSSNIITSLNKDQYELSL